MGWFRRDGEGPPDDAYSRVTEPERFTPLHDWAFEAVAQLQTNYEVTLVESQGIDTELEKRPLSRPTLKLTPIHDSCAPVTIAFTDFPGLAVRFGRWATEWFPSCGCDACDEMPDREFERLARLLGHVVAGRFRESLHLQPGDSGWRNTEFGSTDGHRSARQTRVPRDEASQILNGEAEIVLAWLPWEPKPDDTATL